MKTQHKITPTLQLLGFYSCPCLSGTVSLPITPARGTGGASPGTIWYTTSTPSREVLSPICGAAAQSRDTSKANRMLSPETGSSEEESTTTNSKMV